MDLSKKQLESINNAKSLNDELNIINTKISEELDWILTDMQSSSNEELKEIYNNIPDCLYKYLIFKELKERKSI